MWKMNKLKVLFTIIIAIPSGICFSDVKPTDIKYIEEIMKTWAAKDIKKYLMTTMLFQKIALVVTK